MNEGWINHSILSEKLEKDHHSRDITLALPVLEKKGLLLSKGEKKEKFYILPWVKDVDLQAIYGKRQDIMLGSQLHFDMEDLLENDNLQANLQANKITVYRFDLDEYGRTIKDGRKIITDLQNLQPEFLSSLKALIPREFYDKKKKNKYKVREFVFALCNQQFVTKKYLQSF
ncbi:hypothetical protein ACERCG_05810 [Mannheimia sp. E30BD]|uniref:hypothetical protein n=1 Tax=Mannheimia sp. E30BD TaxID=3278708 RepID=UPI00359DB4A3